jgi:hypothetical protein
MSLPLDPAFSGPPILQQNADTYYGCIPYDKSNTVVVSGGAPQTVEFMVRDSNGIPIDLSVWFPADIPAEEQKHVLTVRFAFADNSVIARSPVLATAVDAAVGKIQFTLPEYVYNMPCIYLFYGAVIERMNEGAKGLLRYVIPGRGALLVEWSPWMEHLDHCPVKHRMVPTLEDVRRWLDDFIGKNDLMSQYEFSADDIVHAMVRPVYIFNEEPPRLRKFRFTLATFPFYENWVHGTAAELLQSAVHHYVRNKLLSQHGGMSGDEKGRDREYMQLAQMYKEEYRQWVHRKKMDLNFSNSQGWGTIHSDYARFG